MRFRNLSLQSRTVAVRTLEIKGGDARRSYDIVKVFEVNPNGQSFISPKEGEFEEYSVSDIIRVF